jgi:hypothetical protein
VTKEETREFLRKFMESFARWIKAASGAAT